MRAVWKFRLVPNQPTWMPTAARALSVGAVALGEDDIGLYVWALVDPDADLVERTFVLAPTGPAQRDEYVNQLQFLGSIQNYYEDGEQIVVHVFERPEDA